MKKLLLGFVLLSAAFGCKTDKKWDAVQRAELHDRIRAYREWRYLENMNDAEFEMLANDVAAFVESSYANLDALNSTPAPQDSLTTAVVGVMASYITTDARNMRYLFPYRHLVREKILPSGLGHDQIKQFYQCLADKINYGYISMENFLWNAMSNNVSATVVGAMQRDCAAPFMVETSELTVSQHKKNKHDHKKDKKEKNKDKSGK